MKHYQIIILWLGSRRPGSSLRVAPERPEGDSTATRQTSPAIPGRRRRRRLARRQRPAATPKLAPAAASSLPATPFFCSPFFPFKLGTTMTSVTMAACRGNRSRVPRDGFRPPPTGYGAPGLEASQLREDGAAARVGASAVA